MFKNIKKEIVVLMLMLGTLTSFVNADTPTAPGPYVGVTDINCTAVRVNFADNSDDEDGFIVSGNFPNSPIILPTNDETTDSQVYVNITGLDCNTTYSINVIAYEGDTNSTTSTGNFNMTTTFGLTNCCSGGEPAQPGPYIGATDINCTAVRINFSDNAINEDGFIVSGDFPNSPMYLPAHTDINSSQVSADITGLESNQTYCITVVAYNNDGNSTPSDTRCFNIESTFGVTTCTSCSECDQNTPVAPGLYVGVTDINDTAVKINFLDNSDNEDGFLLFDASGDINITIPENNTTAPSQTTVDVDGLTCDKTYVVKVLAFNCAGNSETSDNRAFNIKSTFGVTCP